MSKETWLAAYYPVPANKVPVDDALTHSLIKWRGLRPAALAEHGLTVSPITIEGCTCALCVQNPDSCGACPLAISRDGTSCDRSTRHELVSPFSSWVGLSDPEPMIYALEAALENA